MTLHQDSLPSPLVTGAIVRRRRVLSLMAAGSMATALTPMTARAQATTRVRFTLDWRFDGPGAIILLAQAKGYFAAEGLDVQIDAGNGSAAAMQRIVAGTHDIGFADISSLVEFLGNNPTGPKIQAVYMLLEKTPAAAFALKSSGIKVPADMLGKRLGSPVFDAGRKLWPMFAKANRLDASKAAWTNADPALRETLLAKGDLDVITGFYYTSVLNLEARGVKEGDLVVFKYADYGVNLYGNAVLASPAFVAEHPKALAAFLRALNRSIKETIADPKAAIAHVKQREPIVDAAIEERRLRYFLDNFVATPTVRANGLGGIDQPRLRSNIAQIVDVFNLKQYPDADQLFNASFLPPLADRRI